MEATAVEESPGEREMAAEVDPLVDSLVVVASPVAFRLKEDAVLPEDGPLFAVVADDRTFFEK